MSAAVKESVRYRNCTEPEILASFPDGERFRLPLETGLDCADIGGPHHIMSLRKLSSMIGPRARLLELGSGDGFSGFFLAHLVGELTSQDWRGQWQRYASKRYRRSNLKFISGPLEIGVQSAFGDLVDNADKVLLMNPLVRGIEKKRLSQILDLIEDHSAHGLPLFWSEELKAGDQKGLSLLAEEMRDCLGAKRMEGFCLLIAEREVMLWPSNWTGQCQADNHSPLLGSDLMERILERSGDCLVFGPGIPQSWIRDFLLAGCERRYGVLGFEPLRVDALFDPKEPLSMSLQACDLFCSPSDLAGLSPLIDQDKAFRSLWLFAGDTGWREGLREQIRFHLKKGQSIEGYALTDERGILLRIDPHDRLPLFPLLDTTQAIPDWTSISEYLQWTKRKAMMTMTPRLWSLLGGELEKQPHRGLMLLVGFSQDHLDLIRSLWLSGWRIGLGANQPIDQVPLQSFEKFRLQLESQGIQTEALWMGERPPDPAYMRNIHSRFGRLLISTHSIQKSWDSKKVRFCLTMKSGDRIQDLIHQAYSQMAGLDELEDFQMLYDWASALERAGFRQAAKSIFTSLSRSRVPEVLNPARQMAGVYLHLGQIAEAESDLIRAARYYQFSLQQVPGFPDAEDKLAKLKTSGLTV